MRLKEKTIFNNNRVWDGAMETAVVAKKLLEHDSRFEKIDKRLLGHDDRFDVIVKKLLEHDGRFEKIEGDIGQLRQDLLQEIHQGHDEIMVILKRLDQERIFTTEWIRRVESNVEENQGEIKRIKQHLKIH